MQTMKTWLGHRSQHTGPVSFLQATKKWEVQNPVEQNVFLQDALREVKVPVCIYSNLSVVQRLRRRTAHGFELSAVSFKDDQGRCAPESRKGPMGQLECEHITPLGILC
jgi:hypothetical protein